MKKRWIWVGLWALVILIVSVAPSVLMPPNRSDVLWELSADKLGHFVVYAVLAAGIVWAWRSTTSLKRRWLAGIALSTVYGIALEGIQYGLVPSRYFEVDDIIANIIGSLCGSLLTVFCMLKNNNL